MASYMDYCDEDDREALKIHGVFLNDSESDNFSVKSELDYDYYEAQPPPIVINPANVVVIEANNGVNTPEIDSSNNNEFQFEVQGDNSVKHKKKKNQYWKKRSRSRQKQEKVFSREIYNSSFQNFPNVGGERGWRSLAEEIKNAGVDFSRDFESPVFVQNGLNSSDMANTEINYVDDSNVESYFSRLDGYSNFQAVSTVSCAASYPEEIDLSDVDVGHGNFEEKSNFGSSYPQSISSSNNQNEGTKTINTISDLISPSRNQMSDLEEYCSRLLPASNFQAISDNSCAVTNIYSEEINCGGASNSVTDVLSSEDEDDAFGPREIHTISGSVNSNRNQISDSGINMASYFSTSHGYNISSLPTTSCAVEVSNENFEGTNFVTKLLPPSSTIDVPSSEDEDSFGAKKNRDDPASSEDRLNTNENYDIDSRLNQFTPIEAPLNVLASTGREINTYNNVHNPFISSDRVVTAENDFCTPRHSYYSDTSDNFRNTQDDDECCSWFCCW